MREKFFQTYVVREIDNNLTGRPAYRVLDCVHVEIDLNSEHYNGRRVYRCNWRDIAGKVKKPGCVLFSKYYHQKGVFISLRQVLGIRKAGRV